jgi:hypothetical protein
MDERTTLSDEALDQELRAALDVAPSPEFVARVRARVSDDVPATHWLRWPWVAAATAAVGAAAAVLVTIGMLSGPEAPEPVTSLHRAAAVTPPRPVAVPSEVVPPRSTERPRRRAGVVTARVLEPVPAATGVTRRFPEVLLSADEQRLIQMLVRMGRADDAAEAEREQAQTASSAPLPALDIRVIEVDPLPQLARLE